MTDTDTDNNQDLLLSTLVERGGIFYDLPGTTVETIIAGLIQRLPKGVDPGAQGELLKAVLEREALMSTGVGHGIALPHPRNPLVTDADKQFVAIGFPLVPVDWRALDNKPVHTALLIVSASPKLHLRTLSKINFLCQDDSFLSLLKSRYSRDLIIAAIREAEHTWK